MTCLSFRQRPTFPPAYTPVFARTVHIKANQSHVCKFRIFYRFDTFNRPVSVQVFSIYNIGSSGHYLSASFWFVRS